MARTGFVIGCPPTCIPCDGSCPTGDVGPWQPARSSSVVVLVRNQLFYLSALPSTWSIQRLASASASSFASSAMGFGSVSAGVACEAFLAGLRGPLLSRFEYSGGPVFMIFLRCVVIRRAAECCPNHTLGDVARANFATLGYGASGRPCQRVRRAWKPVARAPFCLLGLWILRRWRPFVGGFRSRSGGWSVGVKPGTVFGACSPAVNHVACARAMSQH